MSAPKAKPEDIYDGVVINPVKLHWAACDDLLPDITSKMSYLLRRASYDFQLGDWRRRRRVAEAENNFALLDQLDREFDMIGLP